METNILNVGKRVWFISKDELTTGDLIEGHITQVTDDNIVVLQWDCTGDTVAKRYPLWTVPKTEEIATTVKEADDLAYAYLFNLYLKR